MPDGKYGRLFTEGDVHRLMAYAVYRDRQGARRDLNPLPAVAPVLAEFEADETAPLAFPADEPLFLLRGQDLAAHGGAWGYAYEAQRVGASIEFVTAALGGANDLRDWAEQHRDRMKVPD